MRLNQRNVIEPGAATLLHKRAGRWRVFHWGHAHAEVARLREALRKHGVGEGSRLIISGAFEPDLIFLALAGYSLGAAIQSIGLSVYGEELRHALALSPTHAFVVGRHTITRWLALGALDSKPLILFTKAPMMGHEGNRQIVPLWAEATALPERRIFTQRNASLKGKPIVWVDEGTEWSAGLGAIVAHWLDEGGLLAFPESGESAARDRREIRPSSLLASTQRLQKLDEELLLRLPAPGTWSRKLYDLTLSHPGIWIARLISARVQNILGLPRPPEEGPPSPALVPEGTTS